MYQLFPEQNLGALGDGGAVMSRNADLAARARLVANHGAERKYHYLEVGINSRLDGLQAAFLNVKPDHYHDLIARRQAVADRYDALLAGRAVATSPQSHSSHVFHQYCVMAGCDRSAVQNALKEQGIPTAVLSRCLWVQPAMAEVGRVADGGTPVSQDAAARILALPMQPN